MSYPILYSATETDFSNNGLGILGDCVSCEVTEEANGIFELAMQYPMGGIHYEDIADRSIVKARADQFRDPQLFRVYAISKPMSGIVTVLAEHISYDLSGIPVTPFSAESVPSALSCLESNAVVDCPFTFWTDKTTASSFRVITPASIRSCLGGGTGSILDVYGGEYEFDNYTVKLHNNRGMNRGVSIRYGKNLTDIKQEQNCASVSTGIYPYWAGDVDGNTEVVELPERIINAPGTYDFVKIRALDLSSEFAEKPTIDQLRAKAENYVEANNIGVPTVSLTVSFAQLEQSEEYKDLKLLERVSLFDTVNVEFPALGVSATAKAVKLVYDSIMDRVKSITIGSVKANIADTIVEQQQEIQKAPTKTDLERAKEAATAWLTNGNGYAYFRRDDLGNIVDILFMDTQDPSTAVNVMRVGQSGIGFSHNGVNGPYESAWTIDGNFVADFITTGTLNGSLIKTGVISSADGTIQINLANNKLIVNTTVAGNKGKIEISADSIIGYGWDDVANDWIKSLRLSPGGRLGESGGYTTTLSAEDSGVGMMILSHYGDMLIGGQNCSKLDLWSDNVYIYGNKLYDFVKERGTYNIWKYNIWHSGRAECWGTVTINPTVDGTTSAGASYSTINYVTLPFDMNNMVISGTAQNLCTISNPNSSGGQVSFRLMRPGTMSTEVEVKLYVCGDMA